MNILGIIVKFDDGTHWWVPVPSVTKTPNGVGVGDLVRLLRQSVFGGPAIGDIGVVRTDNDTSIGVEWATFKEGHTLDGSRYGTRDVGVRGWNVDRADVERV